MKNKPLRIILTVLSVILFFTSVVLGVAEIALTFESVEKHYMLFAGIAFVLATLLMIVGNRRQIKDYNEKYGEAPKKSKRNKVVNAIFIPLKIVLLIAYVILLVLDHKTDSFVFLNIQSVCLILLAISSICRELLIEKETKQNEKDDNSAFDSDAQGSNKAE